MGWDSGRDWGTAVGDVCDKLFSGTAQVFSDAAAGCQPLQEGSQYSGHCDSNYHNAKSLGQTSRHTATLIHIFGTFATTVCPALYHRPGHTSVCLLALGDGLKSTDRFDPDGHVFRDRRPI